MKTMTRVLISLLAVILFAAAVCVVLLLSRVGASPLFSNGILDLLILLPAVGIAAVAVVGCVRFRREP